MSACSTGCVYLNGTATVRELFEQAKKIIKPGGLILDIGAGIRPQKLVKGHTIICVEPFGPYADKLVQMGHTVMRKTAQAALQETGPVDTVVMLDVIEHLEKAEGQIVVDLAQAKAQQVIIFTPLGFISQSGDAWGMGGDEWQEHRSGWEPGEFEGWQILSDPQFHGKRGGAFFAIWQASGQA